jgi:hypothetical protein
MSLFFVARTRSETAAVFLPASSTPSHDQRTLNHPAGSRDSAKKWCACDKINRHDAFPAAMHGVSMRSLNKFKKNCHVQDKFNTNK